MTVKISTEWKLLSSYTILVDMIQTISISLIAICQSAVEIYRCILKASYNLSCTYTISNIGHWISLNHQCMTGSKIVLWWLMAKVVIWKYTVTPLSMGHIWAILIQAPLWFTLDNTVCLISTANCLQYKLGL